MQLYDSDSLCNWYPGGWLFIRRSVTLPKPACADIPPHHRLCFAGELWDGHERAMHADAVGGYMAKYLPVPELIVQHRRFASAAAIFSCSGGLYEKELRYINRGPA